MAYSFIGFWIMFWPAVAVYHMIKWYYLPKMLDVLQYFDVPVTANDLLVDAFIIALAVTGVWWVAQGINLKKRLPIHRTLFRPFGEYLVDAGKKWLIVAGLCLWLVCTIMAMIRFPTSGFFGL